MKLQMGAQAEAEEVEQDGKGNKIGVAEGQQASHHPPCHAKNDQQADEMQYGQYAEATGTQCTSLQMVHATV